MELMCISVLRMHNTYLAGSPLLAPPPLPLSTVSVKYSYTQAVAESVLHRGNNTLPANNFIFLGAHNRSDIDN